MDTTVRSGIVADSSARPANRGPSDFPTDRSLQPVDRVYIMGLARTPEKVLPGRERGETHSAMDGFLDIVLSFPTLLFTLGLLGASLYWSLVVVGAADLELVDGLDGLFDGLDGALDGVDGAVDAGAEAAGEAAMEGLLGFTPFVMLANVLRLGRVPLTVSGTFFVLGGFAISYVLAWLGREFPGALPPAAMLTGATLLSLVGAFATSNLASRPLEPFFQLARGRENSSLIGETCELSTGRVDGGFGQAHAQVEGDDLLFQVRCDSPNALRRGDRVLIVSFDRQRHAFVVEPLVSRSSEERPLVTPSKDVATS